MARSRQRRETGGALLAALCLGSLPACTARPGPLEVVPAAAPAEPQPAPRWSLTLQLRAGAELILPLPQDDSVQAIESLLWVVPGGECELAEREGQRTLSAPPGAEVELRVRFALDEQAAPALEPALRERLSQLPREPEALLAAAPGAGLQARLVHGLRWPPDGGPAEWLRWVEVAQGASWIGWAEGERLARARTLRFGTLPPRGAEQAQARVAPGPGREGP